MWGIPLTVTVVFLLRKIVWIEEGRTFGDSEINAVMFLFFGFDFVTIRRNVEVIIFWIDLMGEFRPGEIGVPGELRPGEDSVPGELRLREVSVLGEFRPGEDSNLDEDRCGETSSFGEGHPREVGLPGESHFG